LAHFAIVRREMRQIAQLQIKRSLKINEKFGLARSLQ
jgi:hypothetical protein